MGECSDGTDQSHYPPSRQSTNLKTRKLINNLADAVVEGLLRELDLHHVEGSNTRDGESLVHLDTA
jgi:hypothetical protein